MYLAILIDDRDLHLAGESSRRHEAIHFVRHHADEHCLLATDFKRHHTLVGAEITTFHNNLILVTATLGSEPGHCHRSGRIERNSRIDFLIALT